MRFFWLDLPPGITPPTAGNEWQLSAAESHHLLHVTRAKSGDSLVFTDGRGSFYEAELLGPIGDLARIAVQHVHVDEEELQTPQLILACAVVKGRRFDWALEKSVELGAHQIWPLLTERTVIIPGEGRQQRWRNILQTALKQCGRSWLPELQPTSSLSECLQGLPAGNLRFGDIVSQEAGESGEYTDWWPESGLRPESEDRSTVPPALIWLVGPEGGWTDQERSLLEARGAEPWSLGPHRLRTETAAVAGLVVLQAWRRNWLNAPGAEALP